MVGIPDCDDGSESITVHDTFRSCADMMAALSHALISFNEDPTRQVQSLLTFTLKAS